MMPLPYLALLKRFWPAIPCVILLALLLISRSDARHWHNIADSNAAQAKLANDKLAVSNASIDTLTAALNAKNTESLTRAQQLADAKSASAADQARFDAAQRQDASRIATLKKLASELPDNPQCKAPAALVANLEGL